jgi:hypothetical protein
MKIAVLSAAFIAVSHLPSLIAADTPMLAVPGKVLYEGKLDTSLSAPWRAIKGDWELKDGVWRGSEKPEDKHGAVTRMNTKLKDFIIEYEFKFEGAKSTSLSINAVKDHMARILITPKSVTVQRDDNDHEGPDKAVVFARIPVDFQSGTWHKVRLEMVGDTLLGKVDDLVAWGSNDLFKQERVNPGFTVGGQSVEFRNLTIREATLNPEWEKVKATLPAPGSQLAATPARKGNAKPRKAQ